MHVPDEPRPTHPGRVFLEEVLKPLGITQREAAERLRISYPRMNEIVNGKRSVTPETALRLARFTDTPPETWLDLQQTVDLWEARHADGVEAIRDIEPASPPSGPQTGRARRYGPARVFRLGREHEEDLRSRTSAVERLAAVEALSRETWRLAELSSKSLDRDRTAVKADERDATPPSGAVR